MAEENLVELVEFKATGIDEIAEATKELARQTKEAEDTASKLAEQFNSPVYRRHAAHLEEATRKAEAYTRAIKSTAAAAYLSSEAYQRNAELIRAQDRALALASARAGNRSLGTDVRSGAYGRYAASMMAEKRHEEMLLRRADLDVHRRDIRSGDYGRHQAASLAVDRERHLLDMGARNAGMSADIQSGAYSRHAAATTALDRQAELMKGRADLGIFKKDAASGDYAKHAEAMKAMGREQELITRRAENDAFARDIQSGAYAKHAKEMRLLTREYDQLGKKADLSRLIAEHGKLGGTLRSLMSSAPAGVIGGVMAAGVGMAFNRAQAGFAGTVEQAQADYADQRLNRQFAAIFKPVQDAKTGATNWLARQMEGMSEGQQNAYLELGVGTAGTAAYMARRPIGRAAGWAAGKLGLEAVSARQAGAAAGALHRTQLGPVKTAGTGMAVLEVGSFLGRLAGSVARPMEIDHPEFAGMSVEQLRRASEQAKRQETGIGNFGKNVYERYPGKFADAFAWVGRRFGYETSRRDFRPVSEQLDEYAKLKEQGFVDENGVRTNKRRDVTLSSPGPQDIGYTADQAQLASLQVTEAKNPVLEVLKEIRDRLPEKKSDGNLPPAEYN